MTTTFGAVPARAARPVASPATVVLAVIAGTAIARLVLAAFSGLGTDESYMVGMARHPSLSYVDHPPLHVWIVSATAALTGSEAPFILRLPFIALFAGSTWLMFALGRRLFGARAGMWAAIAFNLAPVFTLAHGSWVLPDGPLIFAMLASANAVARVALSDAPPRNPIAWWLAAGLFAGLALLSKLHGLLVVAGTFLFLLTTSAGRRQLATPGPWLAAALAFLLFLPVIVWNVANAGSGIGFQASRLGTDGLRLDTFLASLGGQVGYLTPVLFVPLAVCLARALVAGPRQPRGWFLALLAAGPVLAFTLASLTARGLPHWQMPGWLFAFPLLGHAIATIAPARAPVVRIVAVALAGVLAVASLAMALQVATGAVQRVAGPDGTRFDPTADLVDWTALRPALAERGLLRPDLPVAAAKWSIAGKVNYALGGAAPVVCLCDRQNHFEHVADWRGFAGRDMVLVARKEDEARRAAAFASRFASLEPVGEVEVERAGTTVLSLVVWLGRDLVADPSAAAR